MTATKNQLYNDAVYPGMIYADVKRINLLNAKNGYGLSVSILRRLIREHKKAREENDVRTMSKIEYRLTDINFHHECGLLINGKYEEAEKELLTFLY